MSLVYDLRLKSSYRFLVYYCARMNSISFILPPQVIAAEGEMNASRALKEASMVITESPAALQLRYLQTLTTIAAEKNSTIVFPLPINMLQGIIGANR